MQVVLAVEGCIFTSIDVPTCSAPTGKKKSQKLKLNFLLDDLPELMYKAVRFTQLWNKYKQDAERYVFRSFDAATVRALVQELIDKHCIELRKHVANNDTVRRCLPPPPHTARAAAALRVCAGRLVRSVCLQRCGSWSVLIWSLSASDCCAAVVDAVIVAVDDIGCRGRVCRCGCVAVVPMCSMPSGRPGISRRLALWCTCIFMLAHACGGSAVERPPPQPCRGAVAERGSPVQEGTTNTVERRSTRTRATVATQRSGDGSGELVLE